MTKTKKKTPVKKKAATARAGGYVAKKKLKLVVDNYPKGARAESLENALLVTPVDEPMGTYGQGDYDDLPARDSASLTIADYALLVLVVVVGFAVGYYLLG